MNLSESAIKDLEQKAFLRGLEKASEIAWQVCGQNRGEYDSYGASEVGSRIDDLIEKMNKDEA